MLKGLQNLVCIGIINLMICTFIRSISSDSVAGIYVSILFCTFFLGLIPARIASKKGRNFLLWWVYGEVLFAIATIHAITLKVDDEYLIASGKMKKCPYCAELVKVEAKVCRYCNNDLTVDNASFNRVSHESDDNIDLSECEQFISRTQLPRRNEEKFLGIGFIPCIVIIIVFSMGVSILSDIKPKSSSEKAYIQAVEYAKKGEWKDCSTYSVGAITEADMNIEKELFEVTDDKMLVLYHYSEAQTSYATADYQNAKFHLSKIDSFYKGEFADEIKQFKRDLKVTN